MNIDKSQLKALAWRTEDHLTDKSATTYDAEVAARWAEKGWPVDPLFDQEQVDVLLSEIEHLHQEPLRQAVAAIASAAARHLAVEAKGCLEKGLLDHIGQLKAESEKMRSFLREVSRTSGDKWAVMAARNLMKEFGHE